MVWAKEHPDLLNTCFDAMFHKDVPSPEEKLHGEVLLCNYTLGKDMNIGKQIAQ